MEIFNCDKTVYIPEYDNGWDVSAVKVRKAKSCGKNSIIINGEMYMEGELFKSADAAWKKIGRLKTSQSDLYRIEELICCI